VKVVQQMTESTVREMDYQLSKKIRQKRSKGALRIIWDFLIGDNEESETNSAITVNHTIGAFKDVEHQLVDRENVLKECKKNIGSEYESVFSSVNLEKAEIYLINLRSMMMANISEVHRTYNNALKTSITEEDLLPWSKNVSTTYPNKEIPDLTRTQLANNDIIPLKVQLQEGMVVLKMELPITRKTPFTRFHVFPISRTQRQMRSGK
jgi:hypothetical protein